MLIKRWESRKGKYFVELYEDNWDGQAYYSYKMDNGGGNLGCITVDKALEACYRLCNYAPSSMREVVLNGQV